MKKCERRTITEERTITTDVVCNKCGVSMVVSDIPCQRQEEDVPRYNGVLVEALGGYASPCLTDNVLYSFGLCEACLVKLMDTFVIPPDLDGMTDETYAEDRKRLAAWADEHARKNDARRARAAEGFCTQCTPEARKRGARRQEPGFCPELASYRLVYPEGHVLASEEHLACYRHVLGLYSKEAQIRLTNPDFPRDADPPVTRRERLDMLEIVLDEVVQYEASVTRQYSAPRPPLLDTIRPRFPKVYATAPALVFALARSWASSETFPLPWADDHSVYMRVRTALGTLVHEVPSWGGPPVPARHLACTCPECQRLNVEAEHAAWRAWAFQRGLTTEWLCGEKKGARADAEIRFWWGHPEGEAMIQRLNAESAAAAYGDADE